MAWRDKGALEVAMAGMIAFVTALPGRCAGLIREQTMAGGNRGQWARHFAVLAIGLPLAHLPPSVTPVSWECGPGYHKPLFGRCVPDPGVPLLRLGRYTTTRHTRHARLPAPIRSMGPWGPTLHS